MTMDIDITMTDDMQPNNTNSNIKLTGIGARLKAAREALQMTDKDAAGRLHLSVKFITVMEAEDFENGPPITFMRGYLRSYAKMLNIPEREVEKALDDLGMNAPPSSALAPKLHQTTASFNETERYVRWLTYLIILVLFILVIMWWSSHSHDEIANKNLPLPAQPTTTPAAQPIANPAPTPAANTSAPTPSAPTIQTPATQPGPASPNLTPTPAQPIQPMTTQPNKSSNPNAAVPTAAVPTAAVPQTTPVAPPSTTQPASNAENTQTMQGSSNAGNEQTVQGSPTASSSATPTDSKPAHREKDDISHMKMSVPEPGLDLDDN